MHVEGVGVERQARFNQELYLLGFDVNGRGFVSESTPFDVERENRPRECVLERAASIEPGFDHFCPSHRLTARWSMSLLKRTVSIPETCRPVDGL